MVYLWLKNTDELVCTFYVAEQMGLWSKDHR